MAMLLPAGGVFDGVGVHQREQRDLLARRLQPGGDLMGDAATEAPSGQVVRTLRLHRPDLAYQIRAVQPEGPYHLAGWCFGGGVAHQMATQLQAAGQQVALLALVDAAPSNTPPDGRHIATPGDLPVSEQQLLRDVLNGFDVDLPRLDGQELDQPVTLAVIREQSGAAGGLAEDSILALIRVLRNNIWLSLDFLPDVFHGNLLYFAAKIDGVPAARWGPHLTGRIEVHEIAARHDHMTHATAVAEIGRVISARLTGGESDG